MYKIWAETLTTDQLNGFYNILIEFQNNGEMKPNTLVRELINDFEEYHELNFHANIGMIERPILMEIARRYFEDENVGIWTC